MSELRERRESHFRSVLKALTWRVIATLTTAAIAYFVIGDLTVAVAIGGIELVLKAVMYYLHERAWQAVPRGTIRRVFYVFRKQPGAA